MRALFAVLALALLAAPAVADVEKPSGKVRITIPPGVDGASITLRYDDGVIHPAPLVKPLTLVITPAPNPIDPQIVLVEPPIAHPMVVVAIVRVPETPDAAVLELGALGVLGFSALVLARRRTSHAIGTLAL